MKTESKLVRSTLEAAGFHYTEGHDWNMMWINTSSKPYLYEGLNEFQKINHFPNSYEITWKDKLAENILWMQEIHGKRPFDIIPDSYVLPEEYGDFYNHFI